MPRNQEKTERQQINEAVTDVRTRRLAVTLAEIKEAERRAQSFLAANPHSVELVIVMKMVEDLYRLYQRASHTSDVTTFSSLTADKIPTLVHNCHAALRAIEEAEDPTVSQDVLISRIRNTPYVREVDRRYT